MANACSPYATPRAVGRAKEEDELFGSIFETANVQGEGKNIKVRKGFDAETLRFKSTQLNAMGFGIDKIYGFLQEKGIVKISVGEDGKQRMILLKVQDAERTGTWSEILETYLTGVGGGTRELANAFITTVNTGGDGMTQGLKLAQQMKHIANTAEIVLGLDQMAGRGLRGRKKPSDLIAALGSERFGRNPEMELEGAEAYQGVLDNIFEKLQDPSKQVEGLSELMELAENVKLMENPVDIVKGTTGLNVVGGAWREYFINGMLSAPTTWAANASGAAWAPIRVYAQMGGAAMMQFMPGVPPDVARQVWVQSAYAVGQIQQSFIDGFILAMHNLKTGRGLYKNFEPAITGAKAQQALGERLELDQTYMDVIDVLGTAIRMPGRFLQAADTGAKLIAARSEVAQRAIAKAAQEGIDLGDTVALQARVTQEMELAFDLVPGFDFLGGLKQFDDVKYGKLTDAYDVNSGLQEGFGGRTVSRVMDEATFQEGNVVATGIDNVLSLGPLQVLKPMVPFVKTPTNIIAQGVMENTLIGPIVKDVVGSAIEAKLSPVGTILEMQKRMLFNPAETARITGQITFMTAFGGAMVGMAATGQITGGGPMRWHKKSMSSNEARVAQTAWERNNTKYSLKWGGDDIPFERFPEPVATLMRIYADLGSSYAYMSQEERDGAFGALTGVAVTGLYNQSMLTGIDAIARTFREEGNFDRIMAKNVQNWFATQTPMSGLMSYVARSTNPYRNAYQAPTWAGFFNNFEQVFGDGVLAKIAQRFPGASHMQPMQYDQLAGEPVPIYPGVGPGGMNPFLQGFPVAPRNRPSDAVWEAVTEMGDGWREYAPPSVKLTVQEQQVLNQKMGRLVIGGKTLAQRILALRRRPDVEQFVKEKGLAGVTKGSSIDRELGKLGTMYGNAVIAEMISNSTSLQRRAALQQIRKNQLKQNDVRGATASMQAIDELLERAKRGF